MEYTIRVEPGGQEFTCARDQPILTAAINANILMPYSCRAGNCGSCCGFVDSGQFDYPNGWPNAISKKEGEEGRALFCSAHPRSDMTIRVMSRRL